VRTCDRRLGRGRVSQAGPAARETRPGCRETRAALEARIVYLLSKAGRRQFPVSESRRPSTASGRTTCRAIIGVFAGFATGQLLRFQDIGFGKAVALDATLVPLLLIAAAMRLTGKRNWYLPPWRRVLLSASGGRGSRRRGLAKARAGMADNGR